MDANDSERLVRLERELAILRVEFAKLREFVRGEMKGTRTADPSMPPLEPEPVLKTAPPPPPPPPKQPAAPWGALLPPSARPEPARPKPAGPSFEKLVGRWVTIALATVTVLSAVGIFVNYAIEQGWLGPTTRVVLGYLGALALGAGGAWLRARGTREFGNVLLAIALGVVHLVCWSAGPLLHVLPSQVALGIGFLASAVLAEFALRHEEQALCAIGFGGAAIAPFVTSDDGKNVVALAIYGLAVVAVSAAAIGSRPWRVALRVTMASFALYLVALAIEPPPAAPLRPVALRLAVLFPLAVLLSIIPFTHALHRRMLIRFVGGGVILGALIRADRGPDLWSLALTVAAAIVMIGALHVTRPGALEGEAAQSTRDDFVATRRAIIDALLLPFGLFFAAIAATPGAVSTQSAGLAVLWTGLAILLAHRTRGRRESEQYAITASLTALWFAPAAFFDYERVRVLAAVGVGLFLLVTATRVDRRPFAVGGFFGLAMASLWALNLVEALPRFEYVPFTTWATAMAAVSTAGWLAAISIVRRPDFLPELDPQTRPILNNFFIGGAGTLGFLWGRAELQGAWSLTASTALLIVYYAATGTLLIWLGRTRNILTLRVIGLGLALLAAGKALVEAFALPNTAVRIAVFFAVSAFLLAVGYWYRRGVDEPGPELERA